MNINQNMQNVQNKYCVPVEYVSKHYVKVMTTTLKLASFVEIYLGWNFMEISWRIYFCGLAAFVYLPLIYFHGWRYIQNVSAVR